MNRNMSKTQWTRHQRMRRDAILAMQHKNATRLSIFDRISEGPPLRFENSLEAICGVISILPTKYAKDYQNMNILSDYAREDYFNDPSLKPKAI